MKTYTDFVQSITGGGFRQSSLVLPALHQVHLSLQLNFKNGFIPTCTAHSNGHNIKKGN